MNIVVVGAGPAGLAASFAASQAGHGVTILDAPGARSAGRVAAGRLAPITEAEFGEQDLTNLCLAALERWGSWAETVSPHIEDPTWFCSTGGITVARHKDDLAAIGRIVSYQQRRGLDVEMLSGPQLRSLEPAVSSSVCGGAINRQECSIDNRLYLGGLRRAALNAGAELIEATVTRVDAGSVTADGRTWKADAVVVAAGAWLNTFRFDGSAERSLPSVYPMKGQILRLAASGTALFPASPLAGIDVYLVPRVNGELVVGATVEDVGFETTVTAGAVHELLRRARELVPAVDEMALVETGVGFRPAAHGLRPELGPVGPDGPFVIAGLYRIGLLLSPLVGDAVMSWLNNTEVPTEILRFSPKTEARTP